MTDNFVHLLQIISVLKVHVPKLVALDGNLSSEVINDAVSFCSEKNIPGMLIRFILPESVIHIIRMYS